uniref:Uncharacterized protein n=1 Tax=Anguilla anguilla TaxID=7936 RepID=A0A0E9SAG0_ANGAN
MNNIHIETAEEVCLQELNQTALTIQPPKGALHISVWNIQYCSSACLLLPFFFFNEPILQIIGP